MKILLINASTKPQGLPLLFPIHLAHLGSYLIERGHQVWAVDLDGPGQPEKKLYQLLSNRNHYDIIGVSCRNLPLLYWLKGFKGLRELLMKLKPHADRLVVGGAALTLFAEFVFPCLPEADIGVIGEGEFTLAAIADNPDGYHGLPGICFRSAGRVVINPRGASMPGRDIPIFRTVPSLDYMAYESAALQTYRGCMNRCPACTLPPLHGTGIRFRPLEDVVADMNFFYNLGIRHIYIIDAEFNLPWVHANRVVDMILKHNPGLTWEAFLRPDLKLNHIFLSKAERAGCIRWHIEPLAGDPGWFEKLQHNITLDDVAHTVQLLTRRTIEARYAFSFDFPQETCKEAMNTLKMILRMHRKGVAWDRFLVYPYFPTPATELGQQTVLLKQVGMSWHINRTIRFMTSICTPLFVMFTINNRKAVYGPPAKERKA